MHLPLDRDPTLTLPRLGGLEPTVHVFDDDQLLALNMAMAAGRPLLVRGEPGTGKSQLARAASEALKRAFVSHVVDARTEVRDLLYTFDAVERLAVAQVLGALLGTGVSRERVELELRERRFVRPGPLWWALDWASAEGHCRDVNATAAIPATPSGWTQAVGSVVLIDEIDKADSSVPDALLDALGHGRFDVPGGEPVARKGAPPLVVFTTNEERALPDAFLRRCIVLHIGLPEDGAKLRERLCTLGRAHFPDLPNSILEEAARQLAEDRQACREAGLAPPGQAEYLDLVRAVRDLAASEKDRLGLLARVSRFCLRKHPPESFV